MDITALSSNASRLADILKQMASSQTNLSQNLMQVAVQNTIDVNKLQNIGSVVDVYA